MSVQYYIFSLFCSPSVSVCYEKNGNSMVEVSFRKKQCGFICFKETNMVYHIAFGFKLYKGLVSEKERITVHYKKGKVCFLILDKHIISLKCTEEQYTRIESYLITKQ